MAFSRIAESAERVVYRIAGLPVAVAALVASPSGREADPLQSAFARRYWHPEGKREWSELLGGLVSWPIALLLASFWFTWRNGALVRERCGKRIVSQFGEQLKLYFSAGVLAPWYYIFSLYDAEGCRRAKGYLQRFETKPSLFLLLKQPHGSPLTDKAGFASYCEPRGIRCVETLLHLEGQPPATRLPERDLFIKPSRGRGGTGAERCDLVGPGMFVGPAGRRISSDELLAHLIERSRHEPVIVQPRLDAHRGLRDLSAGALPTVRAVTCLDEHGAPELIGAVFRMSIGANATVDNLHAGGIAAAIALDGGTLSKATDLGSDVRLGWLVAHPDTNAPIEGRTLPHWGATKQLAISAHRHFADRVVIGWDIAILDDGPLIVEGNGNPDMDILQRFMREGLREHRFARLLAFHLRQRRPAIG